jgi:hypothetical protein
VRAQKIRDRHPIMHGLGMPVADVARAAAMSTRNAGAPAWFSTVTPVAPTCHALSVLRAAPGHIGVINPSVPRGVLDGPTMDGRGTLQLV